MKSVVITGVSTGIGYASAKVLIKSGFHVFGSVRKQEDAARLVHEFGASFTPLVFDMTDEPALKQAAEQVRQELNGETLYGLVNNAGIVVTGPLLQLSSQDLRYQLEVNVVGVLNVTQAFAPLLGCDSALQGSPGRIINIGSVSGKLAFPFIGAYTISKFGLEAFNDTLRQELSLYGIPVILVGPGPVKTPIYDKAAKNLSSVSQQSDYAPSILQSRILFEERWKSALPAERVAVVVLKALNDPHPKLRYPVFSNTFRDWILPRLLPQRMVDAALTKQLGLKHKN
jgi:NAD(P)-dependent dehydrogenase (short-subunit alcohol dehydrogenase family)